MKLGIFVNTDRHLAHLLGITKAARAKGHEVYVFNMDEGTKLLGEAAFQELCTLGGVSMSFCEYNAKGLHVSTEGIPEEIVCGSQYHNAVMVHDVDKVIVL